MRVDIVAQSRERLHLALRTNVPLYLFFGLLFFGLGLVCLRLLAVDARIDFAQQRFGYSQTCLWVIDCGSVQAAARDVRSVALVDHEIELVLRDGAHRLALPQADGDEKAAIVRSLQAALLQPETPVRHAEGSPLAGLLLGLVCIGSGLVILSAIQWVTLKGDRIAGTLEVTCRLLLWPGVRRHLLSLAELESVPVLPSTLRTGRHIVTSWSVGLQARGQGVQDAFRLTFLPMFTEDDAAKLARVISGWVRSY